MALGTRLYLTAGLVALIAIAAVAVTLSSQFTSALGGDSDEPITGPALQQASDAALEHTGGGVVSETEVGDEDSYYEVEVTLDDGSQVDVQLDEDFNVVGEEAEDESGADDDQDGDSD
ncbi:MAG TPA: PepSY domain-containing protein [Dehalococcoidia bacterium]